MRSPDALEETPAMSRKERAAAKAAEREAAKRAADDERLAAKAARQGVTGEDSTTMTRAERKAAAKNDAARNAGAPVDRAESRKTRKAARKRQSEQESAAAGVLLSRPLSAFDFTNDAFMRARNTRILNLCISALVVGAVMVTAGQALSEVVTSSLRENQNEQLAERKTEVEDQLSTVSAAGGLSESQIREHLNSRAAALNSITATEINTGLVVDQLLKAAPPGATVTSLSVVYGASANVGTDVAAVTTTTAPADEEGETPAAPAPPANAHHVSITSNASPEGNAYGDVGAWQEALGRLDYLSNIDVNWSGPPTELVILITATVDPSQQGPLGTELSSQFADVLEGNS